MGRGYSQLSVEERREIARLSSQGRSLRQIASDLHRAPSTIARELKRNSGTRQDYRAGYAEEQARARRWSGGKLDRDAALRERILSHLVQGWSPEQIAGRLRQADGKAVIGAETIYRLNPPSGLRRNDEPLPLGGCWRRTASRGRVRAVPGPYSRSRIFAPLSPARMPGSTGRKRSAWPWLRARRSVWLTAWAMKVATPAFSAIRP